MRDGGRCRRVEVLTADERQFGPEQCWQDVLDRAAAIRRLRELEPGAWLARVTDRHGLETLYAVAEEG